MPSAVALSGWPALPYGQNGQGPAHPKLQPVIHLGVGAELLELMIDELFSFHDASPPMLLRGAPMRPMMRAALATLIMYYEQRFMANEMHLVLTSMREAYTKKVSAVDNAHATLIEWGAEIKKQFDLDNLHLVSRGQHDGTAQVVAAVRGLASTVGRMHAQLSDIGARMVTLETNSNNQSTGVADLIAGVNSLNMLARAPAPQMMQREAAGPPVAPPVAPPVVPPVVPLVAPLVAPLVTPTPLVRNAFTALGAVSRGSGGPPYSLTGKDATEFFLDCMALGGSTPALPSQQQSVAETVLRALKAMANPEEKAVLMLKPRAEGHALSIAKSVVALLLNYFEFRFLTLAVKVPPGLRRGGITRVSSFKEHIKSLSLDISPSAFAAWRKAGCRKRPAQEAAPESEEEGEGAQVPRGVRQSPRPLGLPGQEESSDDESSEEVGRSRPSPVAYAVDAVDLTSD